MLLEDMHLAADAAVVVHNPSNMFYLTGGYTGEGVVYISRSSRTIITDFRYTEQAERQAPDFRCVMTEKSLGHDQWVARLAQEEGVSCAGSISMASAPICSRCWTTCASSARTAPWKNWRKNALTKSITQVRQKVKEKSLGKNLAKKNVRGYNKAEPREER